MNNIVHHAHNIKNFLSLYSFACLSLLGTCLFLFGTTCRNKYMDLLCISVLECLSFPIGNYLSVPVGNHLSQKIHDSILLGNLSVPVG